MGCPYMSRTLGLSEDDWYGSDIASGSSYTVVRNNLSGIADNRVIHCDTGLALTP